MASNKFINLEGLSKTTQALLAKINEQSNLKVNKADVESNLNDGIKIGSIDGIDFYAPEGISEDDFENLASNIYEELDSFIDDNCMIKGQDYVTAGQASGTTLGDCATAEGYNTTASGESSHAEGSDTTASGYSSHAEGSHTIASGNSSHAEGNGTTASEYYSHAEGFYTIASATASHAEGQQTTASGYSSHAEGLHTIASGESSHAEGLSTTASGEFSHTEGNATIASATASHAEGYQTKVTARYAHGEGVSTTASGESSHAEGRGTIASGTSSHAEGYGTVSSGYYSHAEGGSTTASGYQSHAEGNGTIAQRKSQHVFGEYNIADTTGTTAIRGTYVEIVGNGSSTTKSNARTLDWSGNEWLAGTLTVSATPTTAMHVATKDYVDSTIETIPMATNWKNGIAEGSVRTINSHTEEDNYNIGENALTEGYFTKASGIASHAEGYITMASGTASHAEGNMTNATGDLSHAEGHSTTASGASSHAEGSITRASEQSSHAEGRETTASAAYSHAEGFHTRASGTASHAEGDWTKASGTASHAEGSSTTASGYYSHAEGLNTEASGWSSHAEGWFTIAQTKNQHVFGEYNIADTDGTTATRGTYVEIVGNGSSATRSNARTLDWSGNEVVSGKITIGTTPTAAMDVANKGYVDGAISSAIGNVNSFNVSVVQSLPTENIDTHTIYYIANSGTATNAYDEYMYINNNWEKLGTTDIDLSGYAQTTALHAVAFSGDYMDLNDAPTGLSGFDNDMNYIITETDPTVPAWAKASTKPTYTATEVGALPDSTTFVSSFNGNTGAITYTAPVASVNGATGTVVLTASDVGALVDSTTYVSSFNGQTGTITYTAPVTSVNGATGTVVLTASDVGAITNQYMGYFSNNILYMPNGWYYYQGSGDYTYRAPFYVKDSGSDDTITITSTTKLKVKVANQIETFSFGSIWLDGATPVNSVTLSRNNLYLYTYNDGHSEIKTIASLSNISHPVSSVNGATGTVVLTASDVGALADSTTFVSSFNGSTGDITYTAPVTSVNGATGVVSLSASDVGALPSSTTYVSSFNGSTGAINYTPTEIKTISGNIKSEVKTTTNQTMVSSDDGTAWDGYLTINNSNKTVVLGANGANNNRTSITLTSEHISISKNPTNNSDIANKQYVDSAVAAVTYPVTSVNGTTGIVVVDAVKTTAASTNTEYNLIGTASSNANTSAVTVYNQDLLSFAKTNDLSRLTIGSTATPGVVRIYTSASSGTGFTDIKSNASSTNERTITLPDASGTVALTTDIPDVPAWALASSKPSYTFSELTSHPTTLGTYGITDAYTKTEVDGLVSGVLHYKGTKTATTALPSSGNVTGDVWHVSADGSEWAWDGTEWQELGTATDLSGYVPTSRTVNGKALTSDITLSASDVSALSSSTTYVSSFNGSTGAITYTAPVTSVNGQTGAITLTIPDADDHKWNDVELDKDVRVWGTGFVPCLSSATSTTAGLVGISTTAVPQKLASYDTLGYLKSITPAANDDSTNVATTAFVKAAIPSISSWALESTKPTYTASEVGALASSTTFVSSFNGETGAVTYTAPVTSVNGTTGAVVLSIPSTYSDVGAASSSHAHGNLTSGGDITTTATIASGDRIVINDESASKITNSSITFGSSTSQYLANNGTWQNVPTTLPASDVSDWAKASSKPSYTASEVGAASSTHAHGNITSGGDITTTATIASGDRIVINDESASKVTNSSITFGSSTTQYLANNGTWQNVPTAYDDTALAARVTALENIPWVTYYTGSTTPSNAQGNNGDLYFQTTQ